MAQRFYDGHRPSGWSLYWVASDGVEDCFIIARNCRSAKKLEAKMKDFYSDELKVERVLSIPMALEKSYLRLCQKDPTHKRWPWYADDLLLKKIGAQFRDIDGCKETLINDTVFTNSVDGPVTPRTIGLKAIQKFMADPALGRYGEEDRYSTSQMHLLKILGICVARCQEIEHYIAHSFIFCISEK